MSHKRFVAGMVGIITLISLGVACVIAQVTQPQQQATPCDVQVQILTMGRANVETQLAAAIVQLRDMEKKVADAEAKAKLAEKPK